MSQILFSKDALQHIETEIGDKARVYISVREKEVVLTAEFEGKDWNEAYTYVEIGQMKMNSGCILRMFTDAAKRALVSSG